ncbi:prephenate dehydrogenase [Adhaeribacter rhizoryzae]|uniref:Prephenate dehydrogenase n=1 Tax=Adhaeribacter rhizoryzae TaxID=2607907 RepID=A0A5M6DJR4_9BACT|nr:prephenate dehydrogenase [Adhaeribacter rhizoryzae]KAA5547788.1 prephenate dehydrogenase [Adhaeribacter rhizoryzae]
MNICIVGLGLLGGSFALGLKQQDQSYNFIGVDSNPNHANRALELEIVNEILPLEQAVVKADLTVLAVPVNALIAMLNPVLDLLPEQATLIDFGSTKELICRVVEKHPKRAQFVAVHPIAGTENSGPDAAFAGLLPQKIMIICDQEKSRPESVKLVESIFRQLDMRLSYMPADSHDLHLAYVSHLSHISSFALGATVLEKEKDEENIFNMAGSGFSSTVRLAKSSPDMWAPIFTQNSRNISAALDSYIRKLQEFKNMIDNQDEAASYELMKKTNEIRRILSGIDPK